MTKAQLKQKREALGFSQQQLADALGVAKVTVYRWESGMRKIPSMLELTLRTLESEARQSSKKR